LHVYVCVCAHVVVCPRAARWLPSCPDKGIMGSTPVKHEASAQQAAELREIKVCIVPACFAVDGPCTTAGGVLDRAPRSCGCQGQAGGGEGAERGGGAGGEGSGCRGAAAQADCAGVICVCWGVHATACACA